MDYKVVLGLLFLALIASGCSGGSDASVPDEIDVNVYTASEAGQIHKLNVNGTRQWTYKGFKEGVTAVDLDNEKNVYASTRGPASLQKISPNGEKLWSFDGKDGWTRAVRVAKENVYIGGGETVQKISSNGEEIWRYSERFLDPVRALAVSSQGGVYAGIDDQIHKIDSEGDKIWDNRWMSNFVFDLAMDRNGSVYAATMDGVRKVSPEGRKIWSYESYPGGSPNAVTVRSGKVYMVGQSGQLQVIGAKDSELKWWRQLDSWINDVAVDDAGYVYLALDSGEVIKLAPNAEKVWEYTRHEGSVEALTVESLN